MLLNFGDVYFDDVTGDVCDDNEERAERDDEPREDYCDESELEAEYRAKRDESEYWNAQERRKSELADKLIRRAYGEE
ncbi:MAG: hypothetical protein K2N06_07825 [Oscillospiraceae bacterium]|nr:hypothetical protein [Oscillospiraceae bacterium]